MTIRTLVCLMPLALPLLGGCTVNTAGPPPASPHGGHGGHHEAAAGWEKLGERSVQGSVDHDTITVGRAEGKFSALQLKVERSALEMFDMTVTFGDDSTFSPPTRLVFNKDTPSREIDLPGGKRSIKRVDFRYGNLPGGGNAHVELWGR